MAGCVLIRKSAWFIASGVLPQKVHLIYTLEADNKMMFLKPF